MIEKIKLAHLPTPVQKLTRLSDHLGGPDISIKRDDLTGLAFGGNKTRKLETLLARARVEQADLVLTTGAAQSNHCRQTAAAAAATGLECRLILVGDENTPRTGNLFLDDLLGAEIIWTTASERNSILESEFQTAERQGKKPFLIPYGGSNAVGASAYVLAVEEFKQQSRGEEPDWIVFASSSGGTQAGLAAGVQIHELKTKVLGISVDEPAGELKTRVAGLATKTAGLLDQDLKFSADDILVRDDFLGDGYGVMGELEKEAIQLFARTEGILLDPVYTGRAAGGFLRLIKDGYFSNADRVLFWHTGGTPGLFADRYQTQIGK